MERIIRLGALNIVTQPHSPDRYQALLQHVRKRQKAGRIRSDRFGVIGTLGVPDSAKRADAYAQGTLTTFTQIDVEGDWVNVITGEKAEDGERQLIHIPDNLRPNPAYHHFRFYLREHLLIFEIGNSSHRLTPNNAGKLFERLFSAPTVVKEFGDVAVTVMPTRDAISSILREKDIRSLQLRVHAPNPPDDGREAERRFLKRIEGLGARTLEQRVVAKSDRPIKPDAELVEAARIAARNGEVSATVKHGGRTMKVSTTDSPFVYVHEWHTGNNTEENEFGKACDIVRHQLRDDHQ